MRETVYLRDLTLELCEKTPQLDYYLLQNRENQIVVVILPGGGYGGLSAHKGTGYVELLHEHGIASFVCWYRVSTHRFPLSKYTSLPVQIWKDGNAQLAAPQALTV